MESHRDQFDLAAELRALRPTPGPAFVAELDARTAAGFPKTGRRPGAATGRIPVLSEAVDRISSLFQAVPRRRLMAPAGALAVFVIAVATAVVVTSEGGSTTTNISAPLHERGSTLGATRLSEPAPAGAPSSGVASGASNQGSSGVQFSGPAPGTAASESAPSNAGQTSETARPSSGPFAAGAQHRDVERAAEIVLGTTPSEVHEVASRVLQTVHTYQGIVLRSSIHDVGEADSTFDLLIPSSKLSDALAELSEAGEVLSRRESTADVTARTIGLGERLQDAEATVKGLLGQLATAESDSEREVVEAELHSARERAAGLRSRLSSLQRRVHFSRVSLRIDSKPGAVTGGSGHWGLSDALRDAGHILVVAAGVAIVGLAIVGPLALIALLAWLANRAWIRRSRERALG